MRRTARPFAALLALVLAPLFTQAHPLADKIPADAIAYVGWEGTASLGAAYDNSNLRGVVDAMNLKDLVAQMWDKGMKKAQADGKTEEAQLFKDLLQAGFTSKTALYVGPFDITDPQKPIPAIALICQVGKDAGDLAKRLAPVMEKNHKESDPPSAAKAIGDFLVITIGNPVDLTPYLIGAAPAKPTLATDPGFLEASKQVSPTPAMSAYLNGEAAVHFVLDAAKAQGQPGTDRLDKAFEVMGLNAFKHTLITGGFDGRNWNTEMFVELAKERKGYAAFLDNAPLSDDALKSIPKSASWASVLRYDGKRLLDDIRNGAVAIDPAAGKQVNLLLVQGGNFLGVDIEKDLLENHSDEWIFYGNVDASGNSIKGMTIVNKVKDAKVAESTFENLQDFLNLAIAQQGGASAKLLTTLKKGELSLHSIELPEITPTWMVANDKLILAVSQAAAESAAAFDGKENLGANPEFAGLVKKLGVDKYSSFSFVDTAKTLPEAYSVWSAILTHATAQAQEGDVKYALPPLEKIKPFVGPSLDLWWSDAAGMHMKSTESFPMSYQFGGAIFSVEALVLPYLDKYKKKDAAKP